MQGVFAISTACLDPITKLSQMSNGNSLPKLFELGHIDASFLKHYLLIHDSSLPGAVE